MERSGDFDERWDVRDRYGNRLYMTRERWEHVLERRPWLEPFRHQILETLRQGRRKQDPLDASKYKYYQEFPDLLPDYNHLVVVVRFSMGENDRGELTSNNFVLTAWAVFLYGER